MIRIYAVERLLLVLFGLLYAILGLFFVSQAQAFTSPVELQGYAWSPNIGWVSLNCTNNAECATSNYKVQINPDKTLSGYAWNANVGWIQFGGLSGFPGPGSNAAVAGDYISGWSFAGWARAVGYGGGWDGWISLSGTAIDGSPYVVDYSRDGRLSPSAYAWGSDVVGWVNFAQSSFTPPNTAGNICINDYTGTVYVDMWGDIQSATEVTCVEPAVCTDANPVCAEVVIDGTITVNPTLVRENDTVDISWIITDPLSVDSCKVTSNDGGTWTANPSVSTPLTFKTNIFTLTCIPAGGGPDIEVDTAEVRLLPSVFES